MKLYLKNQKGMTLIELMVGMAILVVIMSIFANMYSVAFKSLFYNKEQGFNMQVADDVLNLIDNELKSATLVTSPTADLPEVSELVYQVKEKDNTNTEIILNRKIYLQNNKGKYQICFDNGKNKVLVLIDNFVHKDSLKFKYSKVVNGRLMVEIALDLKNPNKASDPKLHLDIKVLTKNKV